MKLSRNYYKNPLKHGEYPDIKDFKYLYLTLNLVPVKVGIALNITKHKTNYCIKLFNLHKTKEQVKESRELFWKNSTTKYKEERNKKVKQGFQSWTEEQRKSFCTKRKQIRANETEEYKQNRIKAFKETWENRTPEQKQARIDKIIKANASLTEEQKQIKIEKFRNSFAKVWASKTEKEKKSYIDKMQNTKKKRGNLNTSKQEEVIFYLLQEKFSNIVRQYKNEQYPFLCDFYLPEKDLYIEANFNWTHGEHAFDKTNIDDLKTLKKWKEKAKTSDFYKAAIETWTNRDVIKLKYVKKNNLNFIAFYSFKEFRNWISGLTMN